MSRLPAVNAGPNLSWSGRLLTLDDLRPYLASLRELTVGTATIVSPLVLDELRDRKIVLRRDGQTGTKTTLAGSKAGLGYAIQGSDALAASAVKSLERDGLTLVSWSPKGKDAAGWAWSLGLLVKEQARTGLAFASDPALIACIAGKVSGVRPAQVASGLQVSRAMTGFGANLLMVESGSRTFFELKQILKAAATTAASSSAEVERIFKEVDGHAHR